MIGPNFVFVLILPIKADIINILYILIFLSYNLKKNYLWSKLINDLKIKFFKIN